VCKEDFVRVQQKRAETAAVGICIFLFQTLGLLLEDQVVLSPAGHLLTPFHTILMVYFCDHP
jgi:hypothetical protein